MRGRAQTSSRSSAAGWTWCARWSRPRTDWRRWPRCLRYILEVNEHVGPEALQALFERDLGPEAKDAIMTAGQQIFEQGRLKGRQQGVQELLLRFLRQRFGD